MSGIRSRTLSTQHRHYFASAEVAAGGAPRVDVGRLVLQRGAAIVAVGVTIGIAASAIAGPLLAHLQLLADG